MDVTLAKPDVADVDVTHAEPRASPALAADRGTSFDVVMPAAVRRTLQAHADTRHDVEVGGVLVGNVRLAADGRPYLLVEAGIPALAGESRETNITFTADAWARIHEAIDRDHPDATIVGWYHTHPAFGIFLSEMDLFIQRHFFDLPHQIAIVIDPIARTEGCFIWRRGEPELAPILIEADDVAATDLTATEPRAETSDASTQLATEGAASPDAVWSPRRRWGVPFRNAIDDVARLDRSQWAALALLVAIAAVLVGALLHLSMPTIATPH